MNKMDSSPTYFKILNSLGLIIVGLGISALIMPPSACADTIQNFRLTDILGITFAGFGVLSYALSYQHPKYDQVLNYVLRCLLGYFLFYSISVFGLSQIRDIQMYFSYSTMHQKIADLESMEFVWAFFGYSGKYKAVIGWTLLCTSMLLCFRRTRLIGALIMTGLLANIFCLNVFFDVCLKLRSFIYLNASLFIVLSHLPRLYSFFLTDKAVAENSYPLFSDSGKLYQALNYLKLFFIAGTLVYFGWKQDRMLRWTKNHHTNPIEGTWEIVNYEYSADWDIKDSEEIEFLKSNMFVFERGVRGYIVEEDSMSMFKYLVDTSNQQFELYDFHNYRSVDLKGKYELIDPETLKFYGKNNKDSLSILLKKNAKYEKHKK